MKRYNRNKPIQLKLTALAAAGLLLGLSQNAMAVGTASNTTISNLATMSYSVGGVAQTNIGSSAAGNTSGAGTATTFLVDKKVNLTVAEGNATFTSVVPGQTAAVTTFTVTNTGNDTQDFALASTQIVGGVLFGGTDNFDATACGQFVESGATAGYQVAQDTATFIDELVANGAPSTATVYVVCNIPVAQVNGDQATVALTATARIGGTVGLGGALTNNAGTANTAGVDTVFADAAGTDDAVTDAAFSARDAYRVASAILTVSKTASIVCDTVGGTTTPHQIPGSVVRWTVTISNSATAGASATLAQVTDTLNANTTFDTNLITGAGGAAGCVSATGTPESAAGRGFKLDVTGDTRPGTYPKFLTTVADADGGTHAAGVVTIDYSQGMPVEVGYTAGELKPGEAAVVYFNVTVN